MRNFSNMLQRERLLRFSGTAALIVFGFILQGALVFPLLKKTDAQLHANQEAEHLCQQMGRRTKLLKAMHISQPQFDPNRIELITDKLRQLEPKIKIEENDETRQQLLAALEGTYCSLLEQLWEGYSRQNNTIGIKSRGDFYALFLKATAKSLDPFSDFDYFSQFDQMQVPTQNAHQILGLIVLERKDHLLVNRILPFTAAEKEGSIRSGDKIIAIKKDNAARHCCMN